MPAAKLQRWALTEISGSSKKAGPASREPHNVKERVALEKSHTEAEFEDPKLPHVASSHERVPRRDEPTDMRYDAYLSLLDTRIRNAWVRFPHCLITAILASRKTDSTPHSSISSTLSPPTSPPSPTLYTSLPAPTTPSSAQLYRTACAQPPIQNS